MNNTEKILCGLAILVIIGLIILIIKSYSSNKSNVCGKITENSCRTKFPCHCTETPTTATPTTATPTTASPTMTPTAVPTTPYTAAPTTTPYTAAPTTTLVPTPVPTTPVPTTPVPTTPVPTTLVPTSVPTTLVPTPVSTSLSGVGVNLAGAEFGVEWDGNMIPGRVGTYGIEYTYPIVQELNYYNSKGIKLIRLPLRWERMQNNLNGNLNQANVTRTHTFLQQAKNLGMKVILDIHNYARWYGNVIGSSSVPISSFADFWKKMAQEFKIYAPFVLYGLMNEPHDIPVITWWPSAAQAAITAIREVDTTTPILVSGEEWSGAWHWPEANPYLDPIDPANNIIYEAHQYFDNDGSGQYNSEGPYFSGTDTMIGVTRLQPFLNWLKARGARGFIGEYNIPVSQNGTTSNYWKLVLDNFMKELKKNNMSSTLWAGGTWWGTEYLLRLDPTPFYSYPPGNVTSSDDLPQISYIQANNF